jgi:hypothetical protein
MVVINRWLQFSQEGNYANLYEQTYGRKTLGRESEIRRISWYKEREQDYEGKDTEPLMNPYRLYLLSTYYVIQEFLILIPKDSDSLFVYKNTKNKITLLAY